MSDKPHMMFQDELAESFMDGCQLLGEMVRSSLVESQMPPKPVFEWYVLQVAYRFTQAEFMYAHVGEDHKQEYENLATELHMLRQIAGSSKLFALSTKIDDVLRTRTLQLPPGFKPALNA